MAERAIELFQKIDDFDELTISILFRACAQLESARALDLVKQASSTMPQSAYSNPRLVTSLIDALMKCGDVEGAEALFNTTKNKTSATSAAMMKGILFLFHFVVKLPCPS